MKKNVLVTLADKNYIDQAKQLFASAYLAGGWQGDFLLIAYEISDTDLKWFKDRGIITKSFPQIDLNINLNTSYSNRTISITFAKFYLFSEYFKQWNRVVFFDSDIIIKKRLNYLENINGFNAVRDFTQALSFQFIYDNKNILKDILKKYTLKDVSFNVGVMAFTTDIIKRDSLKNLISMAKKYKNITQIPEQAIINLYFYKKWNDLGYAYNAYIPIVGKSCPRIIHFIRWPKFEKPWEKGSLFYREWIQNRKKADKIDLKKKTKQIVYDYSLEKLEDKNTDLLISINYNLHFYHNNIKKNNKELKKYLNN